MIKVSAPGKLMLFGEHSVVYQRPCIVTAVNYRMSTILEKRNDDKVVLNAPEVNLLNYTASLASLDKLHPKEAQFAIRALFNFFEKYKIRSGINIQTKSDFNSKVGLGSSSAVTVNIIKGLSELLGIKMNQEELFELSYKTVLDIQGVGSGFDVAAAIYGKTLFFNLKERIFRLIETEKLPIIIGYTGIKADTTTLVKMVKEKLDKESGKINRIFDEITEIVNLAKIEIENSDWEKVGELMNLNQELLRKIDVSSKELESLISASLSAGAYGAKLSGAGGGDCMIAIAPSDNYHNIKDAIQRVGGQIIEADIQAQGVKVEA